MAKQIWGRELQVGDVMEGLTAATAWTVLAIRPYTGPLANEFRGGARIAEFAGAGGKSAVTIPNGDLIRVHHAAALAPAGAQ